ncbi:hypothetical protein B5X24_HaOG213784 [Helicoverpa armigera]|nr:hypothetical protein B5X24_HaOG213784 [Helicoverpa armigera]
MIIKYDHNSSIYKQLGTNKSVNCIQIPFVIDNLSYLHSAVLTRERWTVVLNRWSADHWWSLEAFQVVREA